MKQLFVLLVVIAAVAAILGFTTPGQNVLCALGFATGCVSLRLLSADLIAPTKAQQCQQLCQQGDIPMSIATQISEVAAKLAAHAQGRVSHLQAQKFEIETRLREIEMQLHSANLASDRLANFEAKIGLDYQCPHCWIEHETRSALTPVGRATRTEDFFHCNTCGLDLSVAI